MEHTPVMLKSVLSFLVGGANGRYVDGTLGGGGYAEAILELSSPDGQLLGLDWDEEALIHSANRLRRFEGRFWLHRAAFSEIPEVLREIGWSEVDGIVLDLGVSSLQLDNPDRGFSFLHDGPLDMRMDRRREITAADLVNNLPCDELEKLISQLGEERWAHRIAKAIVERRKIKPFTRTRELAELIDRVVPRSPHGRRLHPATRTFMALRIKVNQELETLDLFLKRVLAVLRPGGRLCIVSFHSLEDRLVKETFRRWAKGCRCSPLVPHCECEGRPLVRVLTKKVVRPTLEEVKVNRRARSARLRAMEKV